MDAKKWSCGNEREIITQRAESTAAGVRIRQEPLLLQPPFQSHHRRDAFRESGLKCERKKLFVVYGKAGAGWRAAASGVD